MRSLGIKFLTVLFLTGIIAGTAGAVEDPYVKWPIPKEQKREYVKWAHETMEHLRMPPKLIEKYTNPKKPLFYYLFKLAKSITRNDDYLWDYLVRVEDIKKTKGELDPFDIETLANMTTLLDKKEDSLKKYEAVAGSVGLKRAARADWKDAKTAGKMIKKKTPAKK